MPIGCFLSGGIDSATIAAKMQALSPNKVKTFSIGFEEDAFNEAPQAKKIATHLGTDHHETIITTAESLDMAKDAHTAYDEPFSDSSQIPTLLVSKTARQHVTVALSGDGGDEVFGGYNRYRAVQKLWPLISKMPPFLKVGAKNMILLLSPLLNHNFSKSALQANGNLKETLQKMAHVFCSDSIEDFYYKLTSHKIPLTHLPLPHLKPEQRFSHLEPFEHFQYWDLIDYLPNDILTKVDRASMHTGLEARVPLLDHRIVERAWQLPTNTKLRHGESKWLLRQILEKHVPKSIYSGPKRGFATPLSTWLKGPLKKWAEEIIHTDNSFVDKEKAIKIWQQHQTDRHDYGTQIWTVISFNLWHQNHM
ncbi:MAG: asparagine synthase C-terminal domain-containing protein [Holosporaceae bacterium]|nr:MAG: asparagine synthase C-terminal domain-containing protein [Holosporaceae bacterium]